MNGLRLLVGFLLSATFLPAQQLPLLTQYRHNQSVLNPGAVSSEFLAYENNVAFGASYRLQWVGFENAPTTAMVRGDLLLETGGGVHLLTGGYLINDQTGPTGFTGAYGRIGGLISGDPYYGGVGFGLSLGMVQYRVDVSEIRLREEGDILGTEDAQQFYPDVGLGAFAYTVVGDGDYLYGGVSVPQVFGLDLEVRTADGEFLAERVAHFYGVLGFYKFLRDEGFLQPSLWVKYAPNVPVNVDFNLRYQMAANFWIGVGGSSAGAMHGEFGVLVGENLGFGNTLKLGYGFDYHFSSFGPFTGASHEINVSYSLDTNY